MEVLYSNAETAGASVCLMLVGRASINQLNLKCPYHIRFSHDQFGGTSGGAKCVTLSGAQCGPFM